MSTFTSSLPDSLLQRLNDAAKKLNLPKNKLIEKALVIYLDQIKRAEYIKSYKQASQDIDVMALAEEGMADYYAQIEKSNEAG